MKYIVPFPDVSKRFSASATYKSKGHIRIYNDDELTGSKYFAAKDNSDAMLFVYL